MRCSMRFTGLISPESPTSPAIQKPLGISMSKFEERIAEITAKSMAGSFIFKPPAIFKNTSFWASLNPARFSNTASSILSLRRSNPVAER